VHLLSPPVWCSTRLLPLLWFPPPPLLFFFLLFFHSFTPSAPPSVSICTTSCHCNTPFLFTFPFDLMYCFSLRHAPIPFFEFTPTCPVFYLCPPHTRFNSNFTTPVVVLSIDMTALSSPFFVSNFLSNLPSFFFSSSLSPFSLCFAGGRPLLY